MFKNRAAAALIGIFALGAAFMTLTSFSGTSYLCAIFLTVAVAGIAAGVFLRGKNIKYAGIIAVAAFAVAAFSFGAFRVSLDDLMHSVYSQYDGRDGYVNLSAETVSNYSGAVVIEGKVTDDAGMLPKGTSVRLTVTGNDIDPVRPGSYLEAGIHDIKSDIPASRRGDGIDVAAYGSVVAVKNSESFIAKLKYSASAACDDMFADPGVSNIAKSVTVGDRSGLDSYDFAVFANAGISHILAISGLHISIISLALFYFLRALGLGKRACGITGSAFVVFYSALVGFTPGAVRAAFMTCFVMLWRVFAHRGDSFTSMFVSLFIMLMFNPYSLFSTSLQLSFMCCLGMVAAGPYLDRFDLFIFAQKSGAPFFAAAALKLFHAVASSVLITVTATVFSFPVIYFNFDILSYISPLINVFAVPAFSAATVLTLISLAVYAVFPPAAAVMAKPAGLLYSAVYNLSEKIYISGVGSVSIKTGYMYLLFVISVLGIAAVVLSRRSRIRIMTASLAVFAAVFALCVLLSRISIANTLSVEYGTSLRNYVFVSDKGICAYVDLGGKGYEYDTVFENGGTLIDHYAVTALDVNAASRLEAISGRLRIKHIYLPKPENAEEYHAFSRIKQLANRRNCDIIDYDGILTLALGDHELFIFENAGLITLSGVDARISFFNGIDYGDYDYDVAVFTAMNALDVYKVDADIYCIPDGSGYLSFAKRHNCVTFNDSLRIELRESDGEFKVYEP